MGESNVLSLLEQVVIWGIPQTDDEHFEGERLIQVIAKARSTLLHKYLPQYVRMLDVVM